MDARVLEWQKKRTTIRTRLIVLGVVSFLAAAIRFSLTDNGGLIELSLTALGIGGVLGSFYRITVPSPPTLSVPDAGETVPQMEARLSRAEQLRAARDLHLEAEAKSQLAQSIEANTKASHLLAVAEDRSSRPWLVPTPSDDEATRLTREVSRELERIKLISEKVPALWALHDASCKEIDGLSNLSDEVKRTLKRQLSVRIQDAIERLAGGQ